jgi:hypothetical protein
MKMEVLCHMTYEQRVAQFQAEVLPHKTAFEWDIQESLKAFKEEQQAIFGERRETDVKKLSALYELREPVVDWFLQGTKRRFEQYKRAIAPYAAAFTAWRKNYEDFIAEEKGAR